MPGDAALTPAGQLIRLEAATQAGQSPPGWQKRLPRAPCEVQWQGSWRIRRATGQEELDMDTQHGTQILPHLYRVAWWDLAGKDVVNCDVFAVDCGESVVLIDSGRGGPSYPLMKANLARWGLWDRVELCLLTHLHWDHAGGVSQLRADGVSIWGGRGAAAFSQHERAREYFGGEVPALDRVLEDGEAFACSDVRFEMLDTPGHTSTCVSYFAGIDSVRCAFTGDLVMPNGTIGYSGSFDFDAQKLLGSLRRVAQREFNAVLTGHMLRTTQPSGFWMQDGKSHVLRTLQAGLEGKWNIAGQGRQ
jgi:glyoxylase-like metal-dependent hydrolase (beta-lactamase superfamily II)